MAGWIKWYRQAELNNLLNDGEPFDKLHAFLWIVESAATEPTTRKGVKLERGQLWTTLAFMRDTWNWGSKKKVSAFLNELEEANMLKRKGNAKGTLLTVEKYTIFQGRGNEKETQRAYINKKKEEKKAGMTSLGGSSSGTQKKVYRRPPVENWDDPI